MNARYVQWPEAIAGLKATLLPRAKLCGAPVAKDWHRSRRGSPPAFERLCAMETQVAYGETPMCLAHAIEEHSRSEGRSDADLRKVLPGDEP